MPETALCVALFSRISALFSGGHYVDIVGVPSSILGTPTIQIKDLASIRIVPAKFGGTC